MPHTRSDPAIRRRYRAGEPRTFAVGILVTLWAIQLIWVGLLLAVLLRLIGELPVYVFPDFAGSFFIEEYGSSGRHLSHVAPFCLAWLFSKDRP
jgi:hypothetical protein